MIPATKDIKIYRGDVYTLFLRLKKKSDNSYIDITGYTFLAQIRPAIDDNTVLASMSFTIADQVAYKGGVLMYLSAATTAGLTFTGTEREKLIGVWDLQVTNTNGEPSTYFEGTVTLRKDVSKT